MFQEEGPEVDSSRRQIEDVRKCMKEKYYKNKIQKMVKQKTNRICSRMYERRTLQEEDLEYDLVKHKQNMSKNIHKIKITDDVQAEIDDEDDRQ